MRELGRLTALFLIAAVAAGCTAIEETNLFKNAQLNDADAQYKLGLMYYYGGEIPDKSFFAPVTDPNDAFVQVDQDKEKAAEWFRSAAEQGHKEGQYRYALMIRDGDGVIKNPEGAAHFMGRAADQGVAEAQVDYGHMLIGGDGIDKNVAEGVSWLAKGAADTGDVDAQYELGGIYKNGAEGVPANHAMAAKWYEMAALQDHTVSQIELGHLYHDGKGVNQNMAKAAHWYHTAASLEDTEAQYRLGAMYENGKGLPQDFTKASENFIAAADRSHGDAQYHLGLLFKDGRGVDRDLTSAYFWLNLAAATANVSASGDSRMGMLRAKAEKARDEIAKALTLEAVKDTQAEASHWWYVRQTADEN